MGMNGPRTRAINVDYAAIEVADGLTVNDVIVPQFIRHDYTALLVADQVDMQAFIAHRAMKLVAAYEIHKTAESGGTLHIQLTRCQGTEAAASGDVLLSNNSSAGFDGTGTAQTLQTGTIITTNAVNEFAAGNRLGIDYTGDTAGELVGVTITTVWELI